jgi:SAM-dependent methyltransferase
MSLPFKLPPPDGFKLEPIWTGRGFKIGSFEFSVLEYSENFQGWSDELTSLHEVSVGDVHPIDEASRAEAIRQLKLRLQGVNSPAILEIGCSSGYLLRDILSSLPRAIVVGADVVRAPLFRLAQSLPSVPLMRFDLLRCPLPDASFDAVVLLNVLEHIDDDVQALRQIFRLLKPGGFVVLEVPAGPHLYDNYDKALMHFRRYSMSGLVANLERTGFSVVRKSHLGYLIYPAFSYVKRRNQRSAKQDLRLLVSEQAKNTSSSFFIRVAMRVEFFLGRFISYSYGVRCLVSAHKPNDQ